MADSARGKPSKKYLSRGKQLADITRGVMVLDYKYGQGRDLCINTDFYDPSRAFGKLVGERIAKEMEAGQCRSIPVGDRKPPPLTPVEHKRFLAVMKMRKYWKVVARVTFLRDVFRQSKRKIISEAQSDKVLEFFNRLEGKRESKKEKKT